MLNGLKQRILFVDDEERVLQGLRRMLHPMRSEWEMDFALSAHEALERLARGPVDVLVSDMRMPGMDGAQLMGEVMRRYPQTIRIALSGQSEEEINLRLVGPTHQYLSKPCDPGALKATVRRASALRDEINDPPMKCLVAQVGSLPSLPALYRELTAELNSPAPSIYRVGQIIAEDPAMSARILQLVNSAFFGVARRVTSPEEATSLLGLETMHALVLSVSAFPAFDGVEVPGLSMERLWEHSARTGAYAAAIVEAEGGSRAEIDDARTAGLLHDIGRLVLATHLPEEYGRLIEAAHESAAELWAVEERELGASHGLIGAYLLGIWGLPESVVEAVARHHDPEENAGDGFGTLTAVHVANALEHERSEFYSPFPRPRINESYLTRIDKRVRLDSWRELCAGLEATPSSRRQP